MILDSAQNILQSCQKKFSAKQGLWTLLSAKQGLLSAKQGPEAVLSKFAKIASKLPQNCQNCFKIGSQHFLA